MTTMNEFLAEMYGTNKTAAAQSNQEDLEKKASVDLFMKLAGEQNIDLASMPDAEVNRLYQVWEEKRAGAAATEPSAPAAPAEKTAEDDEEKKKREEAEKEHEEKKAAAEKVAEADFLGRVMAHAYVHELQKIAADGGAGTTPAATETPAPTGETKEAKGMPEALRKGLEAARGHAGKVVEKGKELAGKAGDAAKKHKGHAAAAAGGAAAGGAAGFMAGKSKKASAIDELAADRAVFIAHEGGFDAEEAGRKVAAVRELNILGESEKVAHAADVDSAVGIRALEFLEAAGYPVQWTNQ